jgi:lipopolysaccharide export system protein LptA
VKTFRLLQPIKRRIYWIRAMLLPVMIVLSSAFVFADDQPSEKDENQVGEQIQIVADKLITNNAEKYAEFIGDVRASQGNFTITSEHLRIYYKDNLDNLQNQTGSQELIKRIVASGHVKISSDKYIAETERVEYDLDNMVLVLKGENSTIKSGKNLITGSKITIHRKDGQIVVERGAEKRVKAMFYSKEKISKDVQKEE